MAKLSWQPVEMEESAPTLEYHVLMYKDGKEESDEIYKGTETSCSVSGEVLLAGHTHKFAVCASAEGETGKESDSELSCILHVHCFAFAIYAHAVHEITHIQFIVHVYVHMNCNNTGYSINCYTSYRSYAESASSSSITT